MSEHLKEEAIVPYLDARVSTAERAALERHLAACAECRTRVEELRRLLGVLGEWKAMEPSPAFDARLRRRLAEEQEAEPVVGWWRLRPAYGAVLAVAALVALATALWQPSLPDAGKAPPVAVETVPSIEEVPVEITALPPAANGGRAVLENKVLLENYELLEKFDVLFEPREEEKQSP